MALQLNTPVTTKEGFEVANAYGRVGVADNIEGSTLQALVEFYVSEAAFSNGAAPIKLNLENVSVEAYDRAVDGTDVLDLAHDRLIAKLADQGVNAAKVL